MVPEMEKSPFSIQKEKSSSTGDPISKSPQRSATLIAQVSLRTLTIVFTLAAISVIVTDKQTITIFGFQMKARYAYASAFR